MGKKGFHAARLKNSPRLFRLLKFLQSKGKNGATTMEIASKCNLVSPSTVISELRFNGFEISCEYMGLSDTKRKIHKFTLGEAS